MKHNKEYQINSERLTNVEQFCFVFHDIGYDFRYQCLTMADGTKHQFIVKNDSDWLEMPDMDALLAFICDDIYMLKDAFENDYVTKVQD